MNYIDHSLIVISTITGCVTSSAIRLRICVITAGIKKYKSINKSNKKKHAKIVFLAKSQLNTIEVLISKALTDSNISHDDFFLINVLKVLWHERRNKKYMKLINESLNYI